MNQLLIGAILFGCLLPAMARSQDQSEPPVSGADKILQLPSGLFQHIQQKTANLDQQLTRQTLKYLQRMQKREDKLKRRLAKVDSAGASTLFANSSQQYSALASKIQTDSGGRNEPLKGEYQANLDSMRTSLNFLQQHPQVLAAAEAKVGMLGASVQGGTTQLSAVSPQLQGAVSKLQTLQAKMQDAGQVTQYIKDQKEQLAQYIAQHTQFAGLLGKDYQGMNKDLYYYSEQVREYKAMLNDPDKMEQQALALLNKLPAFQSFMRNNSQLSGILNLPANYGTPQGLAGLQTKDQVGQIIQNQVAAGGSGGSAALQSNLSSAESQLDGYKDKLSQLGAGSGDMDMPNFKPNDQKTKTFWKRLEYGVNFQTTRNTTYFPTVTDLGFSLGYKLGHSNTVGVGASYKIGWGSGWNHIALSSQGVGLRSFMDIKLKGSFFVSGGLEYNYTSPFNSLQQISNINYWTASGLIGLSKTISVKSKVFRKTKVQLLWDFLSYQQVPRTQPILFRVSYIF